jgi:hypothetical protein
MDVFLYFPEDRFLKILILMELLSVQILKTKKLGNGFIFILDQGAEGEKNRPSDVLLLM